MTSQMQRFQINRCQAKKDMRLIYLTLATCIVFLSCKKDTSDSQPFLNCEYQTSDSSVLANRLPGNWKWIKSYSGSTGKIYPADKLRILTFKPDSTFSYIEGTTILAQGKWNLKIVPGTSFWGLSLDPASYYLMGDVSVCDNKLQFNFSYLDGDNVFFERIN